MREGALLRHAREKPWGRAEGGNLKKASRERNPKKGRLGLSQGKKGERRKQKLEPKEIGGISSEEGKEGLIVRKKGSASEGEPQRGRRPPEGEKKPV